MNDINETVNPNNNIQLYYRSQMSQQYKQEENNLRKGGFTRQSYAGDRDGHDFDFKIKIMILKSKSWF